MAFLLQTGTALHPTDSTFAFALRGKDLVAIKQAKTDTGTTELHILSESGNYQQFMLQTGTALHQTDGTWAFAMRGDDLVCIKKSGTGSNSTELHILSEASGYQQFILQTGTALHETDGTWAFAMRGSDLVAIKKSTTGTGSTEVHILSAASGYQQFSLQTGTALHETDGNWAFAMRDNDLVAIKKKNTDSCTTELHVLSAASNYQQFSKQTGTVLHETDDTFEFAMDGNNLVAIKKQNTGTGTTEIHVLEPEGYKTLPPLPFVLQTGTALHETDNTWAFAMDGGDLVAIKKSNTGTGSTEVHVLSESSNYQQFTRQTGTALHQTDDTWAFALRGADLVAIKKSNTSSGSTEVHILSESSNYQQFMLQTGTALHQTDGTWAFAMRGDDLVAIKKSNTGTNTTEVHMLSGASNYQQFIVQTGTALHETDGTWDFAIHGDDLVAIKKSGTGSDSTELHVLSGSSNYQQFLLQTDTPLHETDASWAFAVCGDEIVGIKKRNTGTGTTELHLFDIRAFTFGLEIEEVCFDCSECRFDWEAAYLLHGTDVFMRIQLNFDDDIPPATQNMLVNTWQNGIINIWSNKFGCCFDSCCSRKRNVTFTPLFGADNPHHEVRVRTGPGRSNSGLWHTTDGGFVAAHEFGHLLGFADENADPACPDRSPVNTGNVMDNVGVVVSRLISPFCDRHQLRTA